MSVKDPSLAHPPFSPQLCASSYVADVGYSMHMRVSKITRVEVFTSL